MRPKSRGWIKLASADPMAHPLVNPNYLGEASDVEQMVTAIKIAREIFATKAFAPWVGQGAHARPDDPKTDDELRAFVRATADSYHHQAGSCKMGTDDLAVVDPELRVRGVAAVCASPTRASCRSSRPGNCHAGIMMIAERARTGSRRVPRPTPATRACDMSLAGKKVGVLMESDFYEDEIFYYKHRFPEEGVELHFLTRLWGQKSITFHGHEYKAPFECRESFEGMSDAELRQLRGDHRARRRSCPTGCATREDRRTSCRRRPSSCARAFAETRHRQGHHLPRHVARRDRARADPRAAGGLPTTTCTATCATWAPSTPTQDVVVDGDLVTGRTGGHCHLFARAIIDLIAAKDAATEADVRH